MTRYKLHALDGDITGHLDTFDANDTDEAIVLAIIRLERRDMELREGDKVVALISKGGDLTRLDGRPVSVPIVPSV